DPEIYYGIIASGNYIIKNKEQKDKLYKQLGAYCVKMEAFRLINNFSCLIIRGISNYTNGRKNNKWQYYASLTALAYVKELLLKLSSIEVENTPIIRV
ncbi:uncharacterized protein K441DRAFT_580674, partial [Cenococcum geophilum 1.58]|uniref:uncharacterized protein n=1 Tax=Cenococcum geophilum 1.58 TaxID=794803 RepID=UPI00358ECE14